MRTVSRTKVMKEGLGGNQSLPDSIRGQVLVDYLINLMGGEDRVQKLITHKTEIKPIKGENPTLYFYNTPSMDEIIENENNK